MKYAIAMLLALSLVPSLSAQKSTVPSNVPANSKVYIEPMDGFNTYLAAAFGRKHVPLIVVTDESVADFVISGTSGHERAGWAKIVFLGNIHSNDEASISITDPKTKTVAFSYSADKKSTVHGLQTVAEACAKHLKNHMDGKE